MTEAPEIGAACSSTTDGQIAVANLESARRRSWSRFFQDGLQDGVAESVIGYEQLAARFLGDVFGLDRLELLVREVVQVDAASARAALIQARVASTAHRFADARRYLSHAEHAGASAADVQALLLNIDQACGANLDTVLDARRRIADKSNRLEDLVALASLLADIGAYADADRAYRQALSTYKDVSPFPVAWVYFQLGVLRGELAPDPDRASAAAWYRRAVDVLPGYAKARLHLAEIWSADGRASDAEALLRPIVASGDPEVRWRLAGVLSAQSKFSDAEAQMQAARSGYDFLLERHLLAFADHGAEFYAGSGNDCRRALELARINADNRPTLRALEQAHAIAVSAADMGAASELRAEATQRWGDSAAFRSSPLTKH